ncbi:peptidylprolyl isomerase [Mariniblastus fucicola]|uniref:peptidylprolyl isomerase n=1 Tax=Mariniblastus fucicola TaxID=980251 RepID=A0A5B9P8P1_9BACT|nr:peptidylprolyl isomerase [Mariniblastus fucicola]QEG21282.1 Foldase protein PrsA 1 precursor [Mariniblastus fucicola]
MIRRFLIGLAISIVCVGSCNDAWCCQSSIAAVVNDQEISLNVVHYFLDRSLKHLPQAADRVDRNADVVGAGVEHCIDREVILQHLQSGRFKTSEDELDRRVEEQKARLELSGKSFEQFLTDANLSEKEFRRELLWNASWRKYASTFVTVDHLEKQFELKRKYLDGTTLHVAQILWKSSDAETMLTARKVHMALISGKIDWPTAVTAHSESASATNDGDLGSISYSGPMPRDFTKVAFELEEGEFSEPFVSPFGIHLIRCVEITPGKKTFEDVAEELRVFETNRLSQLVADRHRPKADIKIEVQTDFSK